MLETLENEPYRLAWHAYVDWLVFSGWTYEAAQEQADRVTLQLAMEDYE